MVVVVFENSSQSSLKKLRDLETYMNNLPRYVPSKGMPVGKVLGQKSDSHFNSHQFFF